jgi:hypothetical protein
MRPAKPEPVSPPWWRVGRVRLDAEPAAADPTAADPMVAEPTAAEPTAAEPAAAEPTAAEPAVPSGAGRVRRWVKQRRESTGTEVVVDEVGRHQRSQGNGVPAAIPDEPVSWWSRVTGEQPAAKGEPLNWSPPPDAD